MSLPSQAPVVDDKEKRDLFAVYLTVNGLHHLDFEAVLAEPVLRGCLRNTLEAMRRRKRAQLQSAEEFELTP